MLNLFFSGQLKSMPPKLRSDDGRNTVIRPMTYIEEKDLIQFATDQRYPTVRCSCPTCGLPDSKRQVVKRLLAGLEEEHPGLKNQMLAALTNVKEKHLLDRSLLARLGFAGAREADSDEGDEPTSAVAAIAPAVHPAGDERAS
jgi:tRNA 2-thiocytidine biosynthesis protein TtcA